MTDMIDTTAPFGTYALKNRDAQLLRWAQGMPASWLGRRAALILRKAVLAGRHKVIDAVVQGVKYRLYMTDNVSERKFLFLPQFFDRFERELLKSRLGYGSTFVDIGANAGIYTMTAAYCVGSGGRVLSVEPNPAVLDRLRFNLALNEFESRVTVEASCVSDAEGVVELTLDDTNLGGSSLVATRSAKKIPVACAPLLTILKRHNIQKIDALKIDIEGAEDKALIPYFRDQQPQYYPALIILENSPTQWAEDLPAALRAAGYTLLQTTRMNMVWERK
ncbi:MAG TPA: FkbM family methyltransferase [Patescibacteria group bacterium]|nr:FkbM family methyltransferase [Patescibacteria group bacterium]